METKIAHAKNRWLQAKSTIKRDHNSNCVYAQCQRWVKDIDLRGQHSRCNFRTSASWTARWVLWMWRRTWPARLCCPRRPGAAQPSIWLWSAAAGCLRRTARTAECAVWTGAIVDTQWLVQSRCLRRSNLRSELWSECTLPDRNTRRRNSSSDHQGRCQVIWFRFLSRELDSVIKRTRSVVVFRSRQSPPPPPPPTSSASSIKYF